MRFFSIQPPTLSLLSCLVIVGFMSPSHSLFAQDTTLNTTLINLSLTPSTSYLNQANCETQAEELEFTLRGDHQNVSPTRSYTLRLVATTGSSCTYEDTCNEVSLDGGTCSCLKEESTGNSVSTSFKVRDLFDEVCVDGQETNISFFLQYSEAEDPLGYGNLKREETSSAVKLVMDLSPPNTPETAPILTPAEEALVVQLEEVGGDAVEYEVCWRPSNSNLGDLEGFDSCATTTTNSSYRIENLQNGQEYDVVYRAVDDVENISEFSPLSSASPSAVLDFAEIYSGEYPGGERGGCQSYSGFTGSSSLWVILFLIFTWRVRTAKVKREHPSESLCLIPKQQKSHRQSILLIGLIFGLLLFTSASLSHASPWASGQSEKNTTVTLQGASYLPQIDDEFVAGEGQTRPYERVFKNDAPVMFAFQAERHLFQRLGILSIGGGIGYWNVEGKAESQDSNVNESTEMTLRPLSVHLSYRFDYFKQDFPLIPVVKGGLSYYLWTIYDGSGEVARFNTGEEASGGTFGWHYSIGLHFLLDALDREMAWAFDRDAGVNHSYLTFEYQVAVIDDFRDPNSFRLGNDSFFFGLALDL